MGERRVDDELMWHRDIYLVKLVYEVVPICMWLETGGYK